MHQAASAGQMAGRSPAVFMCHESGNQQFITAAKVLTFYPPINY